MPIKTTRYSAADLQRAAGRCTEKRWSHCRDALTQQAEAFAAEGVRIPEFDASWYNPATPYLQTYKQFHGYIFGHRPLFGKVSNLLHAGLVLGNDAWRRQALELALGCAEAIDFRVTHYDSGMEFGFMAWALCDVALGAEDLLQGDERERLHRQLRNVADAIVRCNEIWRTELRRMAFSNHRICHMSVLMALGYLLKDEALVTPTFDPVDDRCFLNYLDGAVYDEGLCYESSLHYHYATTGFLFETALVQRTLYPERPDLFRLEGAYGRTLRDYFQGPIATIFRNLDMPRVGDCYGASMAIGSSRLYFVAYAVFGDPIFGRIASEHEAQHPLAALAYGAETPSTAPLPKAVSRLFPEHGYALLCDDEVIHKQAFLTGDRSGIHHQRDGLQLQVELGDEITLDCTDIKPTSLHGFSDDIHERFNRWAHAHSQLQVDELDQKTYASPIPVREWSTNGKIKRVAMVDEYEALQDGIHQGRFVSMSGRWVCDCVLAASVAEHTWRLFYHLPQGVAENDAFQVALAPTMPDADPWRTFQVTAATKPEAIHHWQSGQAAFTATATRELKLQHFTIPLSADERTGLWAEQRGQHAVFITLISPSPEDTISELTLGIFGEEIIARWDVVSEEIRTRMQARILRPISKK